MTDPDAPDPIHPVPAETPERVRIDEPPPRQRRDFLPLLYLLGFLVLAGSLFYLYQNPSLPAGAAQEAERVDTLQQQLEAVNGRLTALEQRQAPASASMPAPTAAPAQSVNLAPLEARVSALEPRLSTLEPKVSALEPKVADLEPRMSALEPKLSALEPKIAALEPKIADLEPKVATLEPKLTALENRPPPPPPDFGPITAQLDAGLAKQNAALSKQSSDLQGLTNRVNTVEARVTATEKQGSAIAGQLGGIAERNQRIVRLQTATAALEAGQKLGEIPGAPPALARFATEAPPTETALRLSFNSAAEAAQHASQPAIMDDQPLAAKLWTRAQQSVSVRQGDRVLLGDPVSGVLAHARQALDAGDLAGAVSALNGLAGPAAAAMADWVGQARALLEARAALAAMAGRG